MDAKTTTQMLRGWSPGLDGKQQCACACWMAFRTELHLKSLSASETRRQFVSSFWQELTIVLLINKLKGEDCFPLQILATYFPMKIWTHWCQYLQYVSKRIFFLLLYRRTERKQGKWKMNSHGGGLDFYMCVHVRGGVMDVCGNWDSELNRT